MIAETRSKAWTLACLGETRISAIIIVDQHQLVTKQLHNTCASAQGYASMSHE
ncbi:MAG: hypothetical protein IJZ68_07750 [Bacteroidaceae bacterium]|nr:hypothetical protein [Bacteroidaceae bacterium]